MASIVNKIKEAVHPHHSSSQPEGTSGPHNSRVANAADPRVDSDRDHRAAHGTTGTSMTSPTSGNYTSSTTTGYDDPEGVHGPHKSRMANAVDPRVDSDRDHRAAPGSTMGTTGTSMTSPTTGNYTTTSNTTGYDDPEGVHGPHKSRVANAADPRVDSDRDHRAAPGSTTGMTGTGAGLGRTTGVTGGVSTGGPGPAPHTAGPHKSDAMNKIDPRVDSDMDGSYKLGGNSNRV